MRLTPFDDLDPAAVLTPNDVAARLRIDARSVRRAIARGELVASRTCGLRILASDAASWWRGGLVSVPDTVAPVERPRQSREATTARPTTRAGRAPARLPLPTRASS